MNGPTHSHHTAQDMHLPGRRAKAPKTSGTHSGTRWRPDRRLDVGHEGIPVEGVQGGGPIVERAPGRDTQKQQHGARRLWGQNDRRRGGPLLGHMAALGRGRAKSPRLCLCRCSLGAILGRPADLACRPVQPTQRQPKFPSHPGSPGQPQQTGQLKQPDSHRQCHSTSLGKGACHP